MKINWYSTVEVLSNATIATLSNGRVRISALVKATESYVDDSGKRVYKDNPFFINRFMSNAESAQKVAKVIARGKKIAMDGYITIARDIDSKTESVNFFFENFEIVGDVAKARKEAAKTADDIDALAKKVVEMIHAQNESDPFDGDDDDAVNSDDL